MYLYMSSKKEDVYESPEYLRLEKEMKEQENELERMRDERLMTSQEKARLETENKAILKQLDQRQEDLEKTKKELEREFENLANRIFEKKSTVFRENSEHSLKSLLQPFDQNLKEFKKSVSDTYIKNATERSKLGQELKQLRELNQSISKEAHDLTQALKGENKTQGNWGELILERILENSGLEKGREYSVQYSTQGEDGRRIQPDVVVYLPENKHVIIDSKVSLKHYEQYFNAETEEEKEKYIKDHSSSLRAHIKNLHSKAYTSAKELNSPDFVLLFIPIEASFGMAIEADRDLYDFAWSQQIVLVTPSTLLATLRTISSIWKHEKTNQNAAEIAEAAGKLYDKFYNVVKSMEQTSKQFDTARNTLDRTLNQLSEGRGNLISRVEKIRKMGADTSKSLKEASSVLYDKAMDQDDDDADEA